MALRELLARFDVEVDPKGALKKGDKEIEGLSKKLSNLGGLLAGAFAVDKIRGFVTGLADAGDQIIDSSAKLGLSTDSFQRWGLAAKLSGVDAGGFTASIQKMQANVSEAAKGGAVTGGVFQELGVALRDSNGNIRETEEILGAVGVAISELPDQADRTKKSMEAFGKQGAALNVMFKGGKEGLEDLLAEMDRLGGGYSEAALERMGELGDNTDRYEFALNSLKGEIAVGILPQLNNLIAGAAKLIGQFKNSEQATDRVKSALVVLGGVAAVMGAKAIAPWIPLVALLGLAYLVVDDLIGAFNGADSISGRLLDKLFGKGAGKAVFEDIKEDVSAMIKEINNGDSALEAFGKTAEKIAKSVGRFFRDDIPAAIGVMMGTAKGADETWKTLFESAADKEQREKRERFAKYDQQGNFATAGNGAAEQFLRDEMAKAVTEKGKWTDALLKMTPEQRSSFDSKNVIAGTTNPEQLWQENIDRLSLELKRVSENSGTLALVNAQKAIVPGSAGYGFATSRSEEGYATSRTAGDQTVNQSNSITIYAEGEGVLGTIKEGLAPMLRGAAGAIMTGAKKP